MIRSLISGISGMQSFQERMDVIGNNIANAGTVGYKVARSDFADTFNVSLRLATGGAAAVSGGQIGSGVTTESIHNIFTQGALSRTSLKTDMGINGEGFFLVRDTLTNATFATRAGDFRLDPSGYLVNNSGLRVQGYNDTTLSTVGDIKMDLTGAPPTMTVGSKFKDWAVGSDGKILVSASDGTSFIRGQILLQNFVDPQSLVKEGGNTYSNLVNAGPLVAPAPPAAGGLGALQAGVLESSNVDIADQFTQLITTQRGYQANAKIITTSDEMLQEALNLKR